MKNQICFNILNIFVVQFEKKIQIYKKQKFKIVPRGEKQDVF